VARWSAAAKWLRSGRTCAALRRRARADGDAVIGGLGIAARVKHLRVAAPGDGRWGKRAVQDRVLVHVVCIARCGSVLVRASQGARSSHYSVGPKTSCCVVVVTNRVWWWSRIALQEGP
jgi:hypothetical protein